MRIMLFLVWADVVLAVGGTDIECRFAALKENDVVALDEIVGYSIALPYFELIGDFDPYEFTISNHNGLFSIDIYLHDDPLSSIKIPVQDIANQSFGTTVFGLNTIYHEPTDGFISVRYECRKTFW